MAYSEPAVRDGRTAQAAAPAVCCPACGYPLAKPPCPRCHGRVHHIGDDEPVVPGRRLPPLDLLHGMLAFFRAILLLFNRPEFIGRLKLPIAANLVSFLLVAGLIWFGFGSLYEWVLGSEWLLLDSLRAELPPSAPLLLTAVTAMLLGPTLLEAATGSFFDPLAEAVERAMGGPDMQAAETTLWSGMFRGLRDTAHILAIQLVLMFPLLGLALIPGLGLLLAWAVTGALAALVWFEVPCARRGIGLRRRLRILRANWARALGFGLAFQIGMFVPLFNALLLTPAAAVAASVLYFHFDKGGEEG